MPGGKRKFGLGGERATGIRPSVIYYSNLFGLADSNIIQIDVAKQRFSDHDLR